MKKKFGFTLAEVLITLAIIGIIAALVLPALMNNFQFRAVGVRLSKFMSTVENTTRAYVETEGSIDPSNAENINNYVRRCFSMTQAGKYADTDGTFNITQWSDAKTPKAYSGYADKITSATVDSPQIELKDGTRMDIYPLTIESTKDIFPKGSPVPGPEAVGQPALGIVFSPAANALPTTVRRTFGFVVTELGYVFPAPNDGCTWTLFNNRWITRPADFAAGTACANRNEPGTLPYDNGTYTQRVSGS